MSDTTDDRILDKIEKLLRVADGKANQAEAETALALAQKMADAYSIDIEGMRRSSGGKAGARHDEAFGGGLYPYQRSLYAEIAKLNHCLYWSVRGLRKGEKYQHRLVGSRLNVKLAKQLAQYLQGAVERLARDYVGNDPKRYWTKDAHAFRIGCVDALCMRLRSRRYEQEVEREKARETDGPSTSLVLMSDVARREEEANYDFEYGEGAWARAQARRAEWAAQYAKTTAEFAAWEAAHPEEAQAKREREAKERADRNREYEKREARNAARRTGVTRTRKETARDSDAFHAGYDGGRDIGLDPQVGPDGVKGELA